MGVAVSYPGGRMGGGGGGGMDAMGGENTNAVFAFIAGLPAWAQAVINILIVVAAAAIIGMVIGKMYASVRYPDPEKHHLIHPVLRLVFICLIAACCVWLFALMIRVPSQEELTGQNSEGVEVIQGDGLPAGDDYSPAAGF